MLVFLVVLGAWFSAAGASTASAAVMAPGVLCAQSTTSSNGPVQSIQVDCDYTGGAQYVQAPTTGGFNPRIVVSGGGGGDAICSGANDGPGNTCTYGGGSSGATVDDHVPGFSSGGYYQVLVGGRGHDGPTNYTSGTGGFNGGGVGGVFGGTGGPAAAAAARPTSAWALSG